MKFGRVKPVLGVAAVCLAAGIFAGAALTDSPDGRAKEADRYLAVTPPKDVLADMVENIAKTMPEDQRGPYKELMFKHFNIGAMEKAMRAALVKNFTADELKALTDFYGSDVGKSAMKKMGVYMADVMPTIEAEIGAAMQKMAK